MFSGEIFENTPLGRQAWFSTDTSPQVLPPALSPSAPLPSLRRKKKKKKPAIESNVDEGALSHI